MIQQQKTFPIGAFLQKLKQNRESITVYVGGFLLMTAVFGSLNIMRTNSGDLLRFIQLLAFFGMGYIQTTFLQSENFSFLSRKYFFEHLLYVLFMSFCICVFLLVIYLVTNSDVRAAFGSTFAFLFPFLIAVTWFFYKHIPKNEQLIWTESEAIPDELALYFRNKIPVRFHVSRSYFDMKEVQFPVTVSSWVKLGLLFQEFIAEQNKNEAALIEMRDENQNLYGWEFYAESLNGLISRQIDPRLNVRENKIFQHSIIVARRIHVAPLPVEMTQPVRIA